MKQCHISHSTIFNFAPSHHYFLRHHLRVRFFFHSAEVRARKKWQRNDKFLIVLVKFALIVLALALLKLSILKFDAAYYYSIALDMRAFPTTSLPLLLFLLLLFCVSVFKCVSSSVFSIFVRSFPHPNSPHHPVSEPILS